MTRFFNLDLNEASKVTNEDTMESLIALKKRNAKFYIAKGIFNYSLNGKNENATREIDDVQKVFEEIDKF